MEAGTSGKRPRLEDFLGGSVDDDPSMEKKVRFPKGKKARKGDGRLPVASDNVGNDDDDFAPPMDPALAAKERATRRIRNREDAVVGEQVHVGALHDIVSRSEVTYEEDINFEDDGVVFEPFNLNQEREEGYFDDAGNFVEYVRKNDIKDAWLDSIDVEPKFTEKNHETSGNEEEEYHDISADDVGKIKRNIANTLQPGETVIQALKRLKGNSTDKKEKMSDENKRLFDQLTEDAMKLMENGEYNVYYEKQETFDREAEGYERLAHAKANEAKFDMFGDDDDEASTNPELDVKSTSVNPGTVTSNADASVGAENDYVYDESSGYYYSSNLGYYYDPVSGYYCSATSGKWFSYNEQTGAYDEIQDTATTTQGAAPAAVAN